MVNHTETLLSWALKYRELGWSVLPMIPRIEEKKPFVKWKELQTRLPSEEQIRAWWKEHPNANIGMVTGAVSGVVVFDADAKTAHDFIGKQGGMPPTPQALTGKPDGVHFYLRHPGIPVKNDANRELRLDIRGDGGLVVLPPSVHHTGRVYRWAPYLNPWDADIEPLRPWMLDYVRSRNGHGEHRPVEAKASEEIDRIMQCSFMQHCGRDRAILPEIEWYCMVSNLARAQGGVAKIHELSHGHPDYNQRETETKILHGLNDTGPHTCDFIKRHFDCGQDCGVKAPAALARRKVFEIEPDSPPERFHLTDYGNAERLVYHHGQDLRYCAPWGRFLIWDGARWAADFTGEAERRAKRTIRQTYAEAANIADDDKRQDFIKAVLRCEASAKIQAMLTLTKSERAVAIEPSRFDTNPWLLSCLNGTIDLRSGELRPQRREDLITKLAPVEYQPGADCPRWKAHLQRIMNGNQNLISFLQRALGYSITGDTSERKLFIAWGSGANGKSTTVELIAHVLGDYACRTPTETLLIKRDGGIPNDVARLKGARFVYASEAEEGKRLAEALIKDITGGDRVSARFMRGEWFDFQPELKLWLSTNHKPVVRGTDQAIWDRIRLIPFTVSIPEHERIPRYHLMEEFEPELPGILAWLVQGCLDWQKHGLGEPEEVKAATREYRAEMDLLGEFLAECCEMKQIAFVRGKELYTAYTEWSVESGEKKPALSRKAMAARLTERGFTKTIGTGNQIFWGGLRLITKS